MNLPHNTQCVLWMGYIDVIIFHIDQQNDNECVKSSKPSDRKPVKCL